MKNKTYTVCFTSNVEVEATSLDEAMQNAQPNIEQDLDRNTTVQVNGNNLTDAEKKEYGFLSINSPVLP